VPSECSPPRFQGPPRTPAKTPLLSLRHFCVRTSLEILGRSATSSPKGRAPFRLPKRLTLLQLRGVQAERERCTTNNARFVPAYPTISPGNAVERDAKGTWGGEVSTTGWSATGACGVAGVSSTGESSNLSRSVTPIVGQEGSRHLGRSLKLQPHLKWFRELEPSKGLLKLAKESTRPRSAARRSVGKLSRSLVAMSEPTHDAQAYAPIGGSRPKAPAYARDLVGYGQSPPDPRWPGRARIAVQFVINYEEVKLNPKLDRSTY
jgi:hypothetical protein